MFYAVELVSNSRSLEVPITAPRLKAATLELVLVPPWAIDEACCEFGADILDVCTSSLIDVPISSRYFFEALKTNDVPELDKIALAKVADFPSSIDLTFSSSKTFHISKTWETFSQSSTQPFFEPFC